LDGILNILKQNDFPRESGVDSAEVSTFFSWVESAELPEKKTEFATSLPL
jgi:hypothetical protein